MDFDGWPPSMDGSWGLVWYLSNSSVPAHPLGFVTNSTVLFFNVLPPFPSSGGFFGGLGVLAGGVWWSRRLAGCWLITSCYNLRNHQAHATVDFEDTLTHSVL